MTRFGLIDWVQRSVVAIYDDVNWLNVYLDNVCAIKRVMGDGNCDEGLPCWLVVDSVK